MSFVDVQALSAEFADSYGAQAEGVWSAPGRVNLIGEHVDYQDGLCLPIALPQRCWVAMRARDDDRIRLASKQLPERYDLALAEVAPGVPGGWGAYAAGVLALLQRAGHPVTGADLLIDSDVPIGAGLASSAALTTAVGAAASAAFGLGLLDDDAGRRELAAICVRAENEIAGAPTGGLDQAAALRSRTGHALLLDSRDGSVQQLPFDPDAAGLRLLVVNTHAHHTLVDGQYGERRASCEAAAKLLGVRTLRELPFEELDDALPRLTDPMLRKRAEHVVREIERVRQAVAALAADDWKTLGALLTASHGSLRYLFEVSCPELDLVVETALQNRALGARMTGGGFGGSAIVLVRGEQAPLIASEIEQRFASRGWPAPEIFAVSAGEPAH